MSTKPGAAGPFRPRQWAKKQLYSMTFTRPAYEVTGVIGTPLSGITQKTETVTYFFDAVMAGDHDESSTLTKQPVQNGAPISLNIYRHAPRVVLEVMMSDAMATMVNGIYTQVPSSKSISAWQQWVALKNLGVPITLATRLQTYSNMAIVNMRARDEARTAFGLQAVIAFEQILMAQVAVVNTSSRTHQTGSTPQGTVNAMPVPSQVAQSNKVTNPPAKPAPGAGSYSSTPVPTLEEMQGVD
jgi:hypothetical protein